MIEVKTYTNSRKNLHYPTYLCDFMHECAKNGDSPSDVLLGIEKISYDLKEEYGKRIRESLTVEKIAYYMDQSKRHEKNGTLLEWRIGLFRKRI